jgi:hypothetical protein
MTIIDFLQRVRSEPPITLEREVRIPGPEARALFVSGRPVMLSELLNHPDLHSELKTLHYGHVLGPGLEAVAIDEWQARFPQHRLPADIRDLLMQVNGIELWADIDNGDAYFGLLPLDQWTDAASAPFAYIFDAPPTAALVLSYAQDSAGFAVLDTLGRLISGATRSLALRSSA